MILAAPLNHTHVGLGLFVPVKSLADGLAPQEPG